MGRPTGEDDGDDDYGGGGDALGGFLFGNIDEEGKLDNEDLGMVHLNMNFN